MAAFEFEKNGSRLWLLTLYAAASLRKCSWVQHKAWELLGKMEAEGDHRGSVVALREVRECMESLDDMLARAEALKAGSGELLVKVVHVGANEMQMTTG